MLYYCDSDHLVVYYYVCTGMYSRLSFKSHLEEEEDIPEINLPAPEPPHAEAGREEKLLFSELEVSSMMMASYTSSTVLPVRPL